ncbi:MAG: hypothetical protein E7629_04405 [Ruminococcaceae bacterium]|nr:hypothetical protein [Oscillospiraceae bacterium]
MKKIVAMLLLVALLGSCFSSCSAGFAAPDPADYEDTQAPMNASHAAATPWNGSSDTSWYTADPSAAVFYLEDGADLRGLIDLVYSASAPVTFAGKTVKLKNHINLGGKTWSIPATASAFEGTLDGCGYTIGSFTVNATDGDQSLLGVLGGGATVRLLSIADATVTINFPSDDSAIGTLFSRVKTVSGKTTLLEEVSVGANLTKNASSKKVSAVGGMVGCVEGDGAFTVSGSEFSGSINMGAASDQTGGFVGVVKESVTFLAEGCTNNGAITANEKLGGIVGMFEAYSGNATFRGCTNNGTVTVYETSIGGQAGGMVGRYAAKTGNLEFTDCRNTGTLRYEGTAQGGSWLGGIGGYLVGDGGTITSITLTNCSSTGKILANRTSAGLVGFVQNCKKLTAKDCFVNADLQFRINSENNKNPYVGGLFGMINLGGAGTMKSYKAIIENCSVTGTLKTSDVANGPSYTGGFIGALRTTAVEATDCYVDVRFSKENCEEDDVTNVVLGFNQDNASTITPSNFTYHHYDTTATPEDYLILGNENAVIKKLGMQLRTNKGADGILGSADDTCDLRFVFGVRNLSDADKFLGFEVIRKTLGKKVTSHSQTVYCSSIYQQLRAGSTTVSASDYNVDYLFTLVLSGIPASELETRVENGLTRTYIKSTFLDITPFTAEGATAEKNKGDGLTAYGLTPGQLVFQTKHFSGSLPKAFEGAQGVITGKNVSYAPASNVGCVNTKQMKTNDQYVLQSNCTCGGNCGWNAHGAIAYRTGANVPYHYYIDATSYQEYFGTSIDRYEAYHTWSFEVEEDGYYEFCFRIRLKGNDGDVENRYALLQIDNQSYAEQTELFYTITVRDGTLRNNKEDQDSYLVGYGAQLTKGKHTLTVRVPYSTDGINKAASMHFRDFYLIKGAAQANQAKVPTPEGATLYDGNFDNTVTYVVGNANYEAFEAYFKKLEAAGYVLREERSTSYEYLPFDTPNYKEGGDNTRENFFRTYTSKDYMIHTYFCEGTKNLRAVVSPIAEYEEYAAVNKPTDYKTVTTPLFASLDIGAYSDQGFCFVYRLSDGRFILIDGGQWHEGKPIDDTVKLYNWLKAHADYDGDGNYENNKITIAAWLFTHNHSDHINIAMLFHDLFKDEVEIQTYLYNFPSYEYSRSIPGNNVKVDYYTVRVPMMHRLLQNNNTLVAQTGFVYYFADCSIEILYTHSDFYPNEIKSFNNSSTVYKITLAGKTFLVAGDLEEPGQKVCNKMAGNLLDSDFLQITHHGWNGQVEFYQYIVNEEYDDTIVLWTLPRRENTSQYSKPANKWIKENMKHIHFGFENREYDLSK